MILELEVALSCKFLIGIQAESSHVTSHYVYSLSPSLSLVLSAYYLNTEALVKSRYKLSYTFTSSSVQNLSVSILSIPSLVIQKQDT